MNAEKSIAPIPVKDGEVFTIAGMEFIKFPEVNGQTPVVMKDVAFFSEFGENNDLRSSKVLKRMEEEILPKIVKDIGAANLCAFKTDLTTLDGLKPYEDLESYISLPTLDFYRANVSIFDKYNPDRGWWLATPESDIPHDDPGWILCVAPSGGVGIDLYCGGGFGYDYGVRPFLIFKSSIFESSEE